MPRIIPRAETGLPARVTNIDHITLRPLLLLQRGLIVAHHTGNSRSYTGLSIPEVQKVIRAMHMWKANGYNYVIDWAGNVYEFAGEYQAAHCRGFNATGYGVLFLNGNTDMMNDKQLHAFHFLFGMLLFAGRVQHAPMVLGHKELAATACPGNVTGFLKDMRVYNPAMHSLAA